MALGPISGFQPFTPPTGLTGLTGAGADAPPAAAPPPAAGPVDQVNTSPEANETQGAGKAGHHHHHHKHAKPVTQTKAS